MSDIFAERRSRPLTDVCWPVFEFLTNFGRQMKHGTAPAPDAARFEALSALRDAEDLARDDAISERAWHDRVHAMMVYLLDYKMVNSEWEGRDFWINNIMEIDPQILDHVEALGGDLFFDNCDELQKEYELAERRDRRDKDELGDQLSLYFICLRLGFKGKYHDRPQELADYTRRLFTHLPAHAATRGKEMFPETYRHNQEVRIDYKLPMRMTVILVVFALIIIAALSFFNWAWNDAIKDIEDNAMIVTNYQAGSAESRSPAAD